MGRVSSTIGAMLASTLERFGASTRRRGAASGAGLAPPKAWLRKAVTFDDNTGREQSVRCGEDRWEKQTHKLLSREASSKAQ